MELSELSLVIYTPRRYTKTKREKEKETEKEWRERERDSTTHREYVV